MWPREYRYSFNNPLPRNIYNTPFFALRYQTNDQAHYRCAVVVGKKIDGRASTRNSIKRQIVTVIKELLDEGQISYDFVFYLKKEIIGKNRDEQRDVILHSLRELNILPS